MSRDKQVDEMIKTMCGNREAHKTCKLCKSVNPNAIAYCLIEHYAERLAKEGYRKAQDVAREIFEDIERTLNTAIWSQDLEIKTNRAIGFNADAERFAVRKRALEDAKGYLQIVKKKYESEGKG